MPKIRELIYFSIEKLKIKLNNNPFLVVFPNNQI